MNPIPWAVILQLVAPYALELTDYVVSLIQKEAQGKPVTGDDWRGLATLHAAKSGTKMLSDAVVKLPIPA